MAWIKGSQVRILSARQNKAGDLRKRRSPFSLDQDYSPKTHRFQVLTSLRNLSGKTHDAPVKRGPCSREAVRDPMDARLGANAGLLRHRHCE
ncbi:hypothetical protein Ato02nite_050400 [Paractinoplanes toevensis]|uniref:Uncharacterized protein n=1 Tax=Paractinoplanes toevensis TaxID=571911 RepID=A0A919TDE3_9ACTN|nr:hypothetical protein Ato02nite_050400 [Actinoplanes toevensis]